MTVGHSPDVDDQPLYVEYCLANISPQQRVTLEHADIETRGSTCLDRCGRCYRSTFLVVNGSPIDGATCEKFINTLKKGDPE